MNVTLRSILYVFFGVVLAKLFSVCTSLFIARTLQPEEYGIWVAIMLIASYAGIAHLGTIEALLKQYPFLAGKGDMAKALATERNVLGTILLTSALIAVFAFFCPVFVPVSSRESLVPLVRLMLATAGLSLFSTYYYHRFAAHQEFRMVSITDSARAIYTFICLIAFSWLWGLRGAVWGFFLTELIVCIQSVILGNRTCGRVGFSFDLKLMGELVRIGFPITIVWWVCILQQTSDRLISMALLGSSATGYYGLGVSVVFTLALIPQVVGQVLYPKINDGVGKGLDQSQMEQLVVTPARAFSLLLPIAIGILIVLAPAIYDGLFPKYRRGLVSAQILLGGSFFICLFKNGANFLIANHKQNLLLWYALVCLGLNVVITLILVRLGMDIEGIALSSSLSSAVLTTLIWKKVFAVFGYDTMGQWRQIYFLYLPFLMFLTLLGALFLAVPHFFRWTGMLSLSNPLLFIVFMAVLILRVQPLSSWSRELYLLLRVNWGGKG